MQEHLTRFIVFLALSASLRADLTVEHGVIALNTTTGTQTVTLSSACQPKLLLFSWNSSTVSGSAAQAAFGFSAATSTTETALITLRSSDGSLNSDGASSSNTGEVIRHINDAGAVLLSVDLSSINSNGFTLNIVDPDVAAKVSYLAFCGSDISNVAVSAHASPTATGTQDITTIGFQPDAVIAFGISHTAASGSTTSVWPFVGWSVSGAAGNVVGGVATQSADGEKVSFLTDHLIAAPQNASTTTYFIRASVSQFLSNGVRLNWDTVDTSARYFFLVSVKGPQFYASQLTNPASTGTQDYTSAGFQGKGLLTLSSGHTSSGSIIDDLDLTLGMAGSATTSAGANIGGGLNSGTNASDKWYTDNAAAVWTQDGTTPTKRAEAAMSSWLSNGFQLNWTTANATAYQFHYLLIGPAATAAGRVTGPLLIF